jgi:hypothetical protein
MCSATDGWTDTDAVDVRLPLSAPKALKQNLLTFTMFNLIMLIYVVISYLKIVLPIHSHSPPGISSASLLLGPTQTNAFTEFHPRTVHESPEGSRGIT